MRILTEPNILQRFYGKQAEYILVCTLDRRVKFFTGVDHKCLVACETKALFIIVVTVLDQ